MHSRINNFLEEIKILLHSSLDLDRNIQLIILFIELMKIGMLPESL